VLAALDLQEPQYPPLMRPEARQAAPPPWDVRPVTSGGVSTAGGTLSSISAPRY
jgi:hypothetical protein